MSYDATPEAEARHFAEGIAKTVGSFLLKIDRVEMWPHPEGKYLTVDIGHEGHTSGMQIHTDARLVAQHMTVMMQNVRPDLRIEIRQG